MGKVLNDFENNWPGSVSRAVDDILVALPNHASEPIPFGSPVFLDATGGVVPGSGSSTFASFLGFATRIPDKTPDTYSSSVGSWDPQLDGPVEVLVRGTVAVRCIGEPATGGAVYLRLSNNRISATGGDGTIQLTNCTFRKEASLGSGCAEVVVRTRNLL